WRTCNFCRSQRPHAIRTVNVLPLAHQWQQGVQLLERHSLSGLTYMCQHCRALHFLEEKLSRSSNRVPGFSGCCAGGKVELPLFPNPPELIWDLFTGDSRESTHFRQRIRSYNNVLSLTSLGTTETPYRQNDGGVYSFRIKGALYHNHGPLLPIDGERPKFAQIYVHD
ncbi:hypothetical protein L873DRAFT_1562361, partial [Choiromyces venosus 120613-1]